MDDKTNSDIYFYPKSTGGLAVPLKGIDEGESIVCTPYCDVFWKEELKGFLSVGDKRTANTLVIKFQQVL